MHSHYKGLSVSLFLLKNLFVAEVLRHILSACGSFFDVPHGTTASSQAVVQYIAGPPEGGDSPPTRYASAESRLKVTRIETARMSTFGREAPSSPS